MSNNYDEMVKMYEEVLHGRRIKGRYRNSNLVIIDTTPTSRVARSYNNGDISPPTNLSLDQYHTAKEPKKKANKKKEKSIDKTILKLP